VLANQAKINALYGIHRAVGGKGIPALKAGAELFGRCTRRMRTPALTLTGEEATLVRGVLENLRLL